MTVPSRDEAALCSTAFDSDNNPGEWRESCRKQAVEVDSEGGYQLHVIELDDQGRLYQPGNPRINGAALQAEAFQDSVRRFVAESPEGVSVVMFVHGWKHSAYAMDPHLVRYRDTLRQLSDLEKKTCGRAVLGLYVGWRGRNASLAGVTENLTFWSRKAAAERIAEGQVKQILSGLRAVQDITPARSRELTPWPDRRYDCKSRMKTTYVGHSFGGLIVTNATIPTLMREIYESQERARVQRLCEHWMVSDVRSCGMKEASGWKPLLLQPLKQDFDPAVPQMASAPPPDELVIVVNPAVESVRFFPLFALSQQGDRSKPRAPRFVSITSHADKATRLAFPIARRINTTTKSYPAGDSSARKSARVAMGHDSNYLTHRLVSVTEKVGSGKKMCLPKDSGRGASPSVAPVIAVSPTVQIAPVIKMVQQASLNRDPERIQKYPRSYLVDTCARDFQSEEVTIELQRLDDGDPAKALRSNTEVWNIATDSPILADHNDFDNQRLLGFIGYLYEESMQATSVADKDLNRPADSAGKMSVKGKLSAAGSSN